MKPVSYFDNKPQFDLYDVLQYGSPEKYGYDEYIVLDNYEVSRPFVSDYKIEQERRGATRAVHRYCKIKRFRHLVNNLLGGSRVFINDPDLFITVALELDYDKHRIWDSCRSILKSHGWSKYYNKIPSILQQIGYKNIIRGATGVVIENIMNDFKIICANFNSVDLNGRSYLLNYRFIALKLMERHGIVFEYDIPKIRTLRVIKPIEDLWLQLSKFLPPNKMDEGEKKRKLDKVETRDLAEMLEKYMDASRDIAQLISILFEKIVQFENLLNKP
jgi:hypothetical protein